MVGTSSSVISPTSTFSVYAWTLVPMDADTLASAASSSCSTSASRKSLSSWTSLRCAWMTKSGRRDAPTTTLRLPQSVSAVRADARGCCSQEGRKRLSRPRLRGRGGERVHRLRGRQRGLCGRVGRPVHRSPDGLDHLERAGHRSLYRGAHRSLLLRQLLDQRDA